MASCVLLYLVLKLGVQIGHQLSARTTYCAGKSFSFTLFASYETVHAHEFEHIDVTSRRHTCAPWPCVSFSFLATETGTRERVHELWAVVGLHVGNGSIPEISRFPDLIVLASPGIPLLVNTQDKRRCDAKLSKRKPHAKPD